MASDEPKKILARTLTFQIANEVRPLMQAALDADLDLAKIVNAALRRYFREESRKAARLQMKRGAEYLRKTAAATRAGQGTPAQYSS